MAYGKSDLRESFRMERDSGDPWGSVMGWLFDIADEMERRGSEHPVEWRYRPGAFGPPDESECNAGGVLDATDDALEQFGRVLNRYADKLRIAGKDY